MSPAPSELAQSLPVRIKQLDKDLVVLFVQVYCIQVNRMTVLTQTVTDVDKILIVISPKVSK